MPQLSSADEVDPEVPLHQHSTIRDPAGGGLPAEATGGARTDRAGPRFASGVLSTTKLTALLRFTAPTATEG
ncbi:hypothetical protein GS506_04480 [Rhodococcus hoagii]|nr:hypothetical protein [Prescottella equi]